MEEDLDYEIYSLTVNAKAVSGRGERTPLRVMSSVRVMNAMSDQYPAHKWPIGCYRASSQWMQRAVIVERVWFNANIARAVRLLRPGYSVAVCRPLDARH